MRCKFCESIIEEFIIIFIIVTEVNTTNDNNFWPYYVKDYNNFKKPPSTEKYQPQTSDTKDFTSSYLPTFQKVPGIIEVTPGQTAILSCLVSNLGDRMVSWIRSQDLQILTSGSIVFTADPRFLSEHPHEGNTNWGLQIQNTRQTDSGNYECQINTEPKMKNNVTLIVREPQLMDFPYTGTMIEGPREQIVKNGTTVTFTCTSTYSHSNSLVNNNISTTRAIVWIKDSEVISYQASRGGINIYIEWGITSVKSTITLAAVTPNDSGEYICRTADQSEDKINLVVVHGTKLYKNRMPSQSGSFHSSFAYSYTSLIGFLLLNVFIIK